MDNEQVDEMTRVVDRMVKDRLGELEGALLRRVERVVEQTVSRSRKKKGKRPPAVSQLPMVQVLSVTVGALGVPTDPTGTIAVPILPGGGPTSVTVVVAYRGPSLVAWLLDVANSNNDSNPSG